MSLSHEPAGLKILARIKIYILSRAKLLYTVWDEIPCNWQLWFQQKEVEKQILSLIFDHVLLEFHLNLCTVIFLGYRSGTKFDKTNHLIRWNAGLMIVFPVLKYVKPAIFKAHHFSQINAMLPTYIWNIIHIPKIYT